MTPRPATPAAKYREGLVAAGVALILAVGGCAGSSSSDQTRKFAGGYELARDQLRDTSGAIGAAIQHAPSQSDRQIVSTFRSLAGRWQTQLSQLQNLKPPPDLSTEFNTLSGAASRVESDLNSVITAASIHSYSAAQQAGASIINDMTSVRHADTTITRKLHNT